MPITDISFTDGLFFARETGTIDVDDAKLWASHAQKYAASSQTPIVALVDAIEVTSVTPQAQQIFAAASRIPNLNCAAVATRNPVSTMTARVISNRAAHEHTHLFATLESAKSFAKGRLQQLQQDG